ncbi:MAG: ureidoglycolate lyase [Spirochaetales bacterium]|nr:ureidoglycolate lyase [Spirochaetales bacterium]
MEKKTVKLSPMSAEAFSEYGTFISGGIKAPDADIPELKFWNRLGVLGHAGDTSVSIVQTYGKNGLLEETLESHFNTGEALLPTEDIFVVVALAEKNNPQKPNLETIKAFPVKKGEAVIFSPGVWHHAPLTEAETANTFVVFKSDTPETDCLALELKDEFGLYYEVEK